MKKKQLFILALVMSLVLAGGFYGVKSYAGDGSLRFSYVSTPGNGSDVVIGTYQYVYASAEGGSGEYLYSIGYYDKDGNEVVTTNYSGNNTMGLPLPYVGDITYFITIKDAQEGTVIKKDIPSHIYGPEITSVETSVSSPAAVGSKVKFKFNTEHVLDYRGGNMYIISISDKTTNERVASFHTYTEGKDNMIWEPERAGSYVVNCTLSTVLHGSCQYSFDFEVTDGNNTDNEVTIYYKGFENPNIHYTVDGSNWTDVPGVKMDSCDFNGYKYVANVKLNGSDNLTCCFNDGNGNWDSAYGNNYNFKAGKYYFHDGKIEPVTNNVTVEDKVVIYYKGFSTPYFHYSIRGAWTSVPGIKMEECKDVEGYTHKIEINLPGDETLKCCFNDGNGNWDNNNSKDYTFKKGIYYCNNGNIEKK